MDNPQSQSFPTSILNNQKVPGRDRGSLRNSLSDKATIIIAIVCQASCQVLNLHALAPRDCHQAYVRGTTITPLYRWGDWRPREVTPLVHGHTASQWQSQD